MIFLIALPKIFLWPHYSGAPGARGPRFIEPHEPGSYATETRPRPNARGRGRGRGQLVEVKPKFWSPGQSGLEVLTSLVLALQCLYCCPAGCEEGTDMKITCIGHLLYSLYITHFCLDKNQSIF